MNLILFVLLVCYSAAQDLFVDSTALALEESQPPVFEIDMRKPATERHVEVWKHFSTQLLKVQNLFIHQLNSRDEAYLKWFNDNEKKFASVQPEVYGFAQSIYNELQPQQANYTVPMALLVNSIVDFSSFCTSILTVNDTDIKHVRNLDFDFPAEM